MKNLIYQTYTGKLPDHARMSAVSFKRYADNIGAEYVFRHNPNYISRSKWYAFWYNQVAPFLDNTFDDYDKVLFVSADTIARERNSYNNIFDLDIEDVALSETPPLFRIFNRKIKNDTQHLKVQQEELWVDYLYNKHFINIERFESGELKKYLTNMMLFSKTGREKVKRNFLNFDDYVVNLVKSELKLSNINKYFNINLMNPIFKKTILDDTLWSATVSYEPLLDTATKAGRIFKRYHEDTNFIYLNFLDNFTLSEREIRDRLNP